MAEITIYCDAEYCRHNEDGFCWADRVCINENGECTEVVKCAEPKCGRWIDAREQCGSFMCSECEYQSVAKYNFCPNCGARMEMGNENG